MANATLGKISAKIMIFKNIRLKEKIMLGLRLELG